LKESKSTAVSGKIGQHFNKKHTKI